MTPCARFDSLEDRTPDPNPLEDVELPDFLSEFKPPEPQQMPDPRRQMPDDDPVGRGRPSCGALPQGAAGGRNRMR